MSNNVVNRNNVVVVGLDGLTLKSTKTKTLRKGESLPKVNLDADQPHTVTVPTPTTMFGSDTSTPTQHVTDVLVNVPGLEALGVEARDPWSGEKLDTVEESPTLAPKAAKKAAKKSKTK